MTPEQLVEIKTWLKYHRKLDKEEARATVRSRYRESELRYGQQ